MLKKSLLPVALILMATLALTGCSSEETKDPYAEISLRQGTYGPPVISKGWKYKIVNPEIVEAVGHLCLVREGNITAIIVGRSIADKIEALDMSDITFNCKKKYTPFTHFRAETIVSGADTVFLASAGSIYYPRLSDVENFRARDHDEASMNRFRYNDSSGLGRLVDKQFSIQATLARVEEDGDEVWMLVGDRGSLRITKPDDATEIILRLLLKENLLFDGGITFDEREDWGDRRDNHVAGSVTVDFVKYMGKVFST